MLYRAIGLMSGSSLDGLDIVFAEFHENAGHWSWEIKAADCYPYDGDWTARLRGATELTARDYLLLHAEYGHYLGAAVNRFIEEQGLHYQVALVSSHGHTSFHLPAQKMTGQLGDGAAIAAATGLPVVSDLRALDVALGGQGAPIVPMGEALLFTDFRIFLNLGGIANIAIHNGPPTAFDVCPANRVLNALAQKEGKDYDADGSLAASGKVNEALLQQLDALDFYGQPAPKSLANDFGTGTVLPLIEAAGLSTADALRTYVEHIAGQVARALTGNLPEGLLSRRMLVTGGGAFNGFLVERLKAHLEKAGIELVVPDEKLVAYKEALIMALLGVLRWREESTVRAAATGARRDSVGGAMWMGQEA
ncbi:anhydro-N-acetylmuramic acid kinase [Flaviaesturariibacter flavus]|uniref:Anhydro-N-acetylmuramic acid kinase n=1 Tax=Flaviaesturariibacter flavus TaxID=2502780 RepID=A0A4R1B990_9BACT|nr:anhydro-N-acetylmuramic acid kinase [Flaviaesturariibacter flavus]TCJ13329.1 anhydro-N-acetylmuramic acid kinase [Flaviaesturariibacter flavus]